MFNMLLKCFLVLYCVTTVVFASILRDALASVNESKLSELEGVIKKISKTWINHDAILVSHNNRSDDRVKEVTNMISSILVPLHPIYSYEMSKPFKHEVNGPLAATSRSFVIIVYGAPLAPNRTEIQDIVKEINQLSHTKHSPKILLIVLVDQMNIQLRDQLILMWSSGYPYVIILEASSSFEEVEIPMYVHSFNLSSNYSRFPYNGDVSTWYMDQFRNIGGRTINVCTNTERVFYNRIVNIHLTAIAETLNVSFRDPEKISGKINCFFQNSLSYLLYHSDYSTTVDHTVPIYQDKLCLFVPPIKQRVTGMKWGLTVAFVVGILIVLMIFGFSMLARIRAFTYPFNVIAVILGVWLNSMRLSSRMEKIIYLCLVQIATRYMSMLYTEMFSESAVRQGEVTINDFEDLHGLNLTIKVDQSMYNHFIGNNTIVPPSLFHVFHKIITLYNETQCRDCSYFSQQVLEAYRPKGHVVYPKRITRLCQGNVAVVHAISQKWQLKEVVNDILLRINQCGIRERENALAFLKTDEQPTEEYIDVASSAQQRMMIGMLCGYLLSVAILAAELLVARIQRWRIARSRRRFVRNLSIVRKTLMRN